MRCTREVRFTPNSGSQQPPLKATLSADFLRKSASSNVGRRLEFLRWPLILLFGSTLRAPFLPTRSRKTQIDSRRRSGDQPCQATKVLRDGGKRKLILRTAWASQSKSAQFQNALKVGKQHLHALATATGLLESLGLGQCMGDTLQEIIPSVRQTVPNGRCNRGGASV